MEQGIDLDLQIASLRMEGADQFDPVRFRFLEALATRLRQQPEKARHILKAKLTEALAAYKERFEKRQDEARNVIARVTTQYPDAVDDLQRLFVTGDLRGLSRFVAMLKQRDRQTSFAELTRHIAEHSRGGTDEVLAEVIGSRSELKAMRYYRSTWSRLSVDRQVRQALERAPENAGPLNSHRLVLHSLALMRDISPDYLKRFMSYADTLLWLDQADTQARPIAKKALATKTSRR